MANRRKACFVFSWYLISGGLNEVCEPNILRFPEKTPRIRWFFIAEFEV